MDAVRTAARAIIQRDDTLLVIRYRDELGEWYVLPGGGQVHGEPLEATLRREVEEETGAIIQVGALRFVRECVAAPGGLRLPSRFHQVEVIFTAELTGPVTQGSSPDASQLTVEWRTIPELRARSFFPAGLLDALESGQGPQYLGII